MQNTNKYGGIDEPEEIGGEEGAAQQLKRVLAGRLPLLYRRAYRILGNTADAEDAVQDALLAAFTHLDQFRGQAQISTWLTSIVLNCARLQLRRRPRHVHLSLDQSNGQLQPLPVSERLADQRPSPEDESIKCELSACLSHLHRQLSPKLRRTFQLRDIDGLSISETARILAVPTGTVKAQSARARRRLKELMQHTLRQRSHRLPMDSCISQFPVAEIGRHRITTQMARVKSESDRASVVVKGARETPVTHAVSLHTEEELT